MGNIVTNRISHFLHVQDFEFLVYSVCSYATQSLSECLSRLRCLVLRDSCKTHSLQLNKDCSLISLQPKKSKKAEGKSPGNASYRRTSLIPKFWFGYETLVWILVIIAGSSSLFLCVCVCLLAAAKKSVKITSPKKEQPVSDSFVKN